MTYWPAPKAFWKRLRSKWPAGKRTGEMGLLKDHLRCISEREWMWWRRLLNLAYELTTECPFERWKYTELISLQKEIGNDDTAKQRPIQLMDCMANTWNAAGIKKLDNRRESEQCKSDMQVGFTRNKSPWHVHHRVYHTAMEGQRFDEYKGQFMYIALDDAMRCFDSVRDSIQALSQGALGANMEHAERTAKDNATRMTTIITADGPSEEILSWKRTIAIWLQDGKVTREPDGELANAEINKKETTNNRMEFIAWITEDELTALETGVETSKLETVIGLKQEERTSSDERKSKEET